MIQDFANWLVYKILEFTPHTQLGEAVNFFVYDTVKILFLLYAISLIMGVVNAYFPVERIRVFLITRKLYGLQYFFAALFGAMTPFCSCSSIPLFIGFVKGGIPLGVTFAFLITSPLVNEVAIAIFLGAFGIKITVIYAVSGILLGMVGGIVLEKFKLERYLSPWIRDLLVQSNRSAYPYCGRRRRIGLYRSSAIRNNSRCQALSSSATDALARAEASVDMFPAYSFSVRGVASCYAVRRTTTLCRRTDSPGGRCSSRGIYFSCGTAEETVSIMDSIRPHQTVPAFG